MPRKRTRGIRLRFAAWRDRHGAVLEGDVAQVRGHRDRRRSAHVRTRSPREVHAVVVESESRNRRGVPPIEVELLPIRIDGQRLEVTPVSDQVAPYLADADRVLLVDTVKADGPPGTIRIYSRAELLARPPQPRVSPHDPGLTEALLALDFVGSAPRDVVLIGVVPGAVAKGIGLTPAVKDAVGRAAAEVVRLLSGLGLSPRGKASASPASPWWEKPAASTPAA